MRVLQASSLERTKDTPRSEKRDTVTRMRAERGNIIKKRAERGFLYEWVPPSATTVSNLRLMANKAEGMRRYEPMVNAATILARQG